MPPDVEPDLTVSTTAPTEARRLAARITAEVERQLAAPLSAGLYLVATPIGNLGDITLRALTTLQQADLILCEDTRHSRTLTAHFGIGGPLKPYHEHNEDVERPRVLGLIGEGQAVALISDAGTPLVSDPGFKLAREAAEQGFKVTALPGASAVLAGLSVSGLPSDAFMFAGFLPPKEGARKQRLMDLANVPATLVLFEAPSRIARSLATMAEVFGGREVVVARELTKRFEEIKRGTAAELAAWADGAEVKGEFVVLVGPPGAATATDAMIEQALIVALATGSLRDAVREVTEAFGAQKSRVYEIGLRVRARLGDRAAGKEDT